jgi:hypothetical protein
MPRTVTIKSLPQTFAVNKEMQGQDCDWGEDYRAAGRAALVEILEGQMALRVDRHLEEMAARGTADRRNGAYAKSRSSPPIPSAQ